MKQIIERSFQMKIDTRKLKKHRENAKITKKEMAKKIGVSEISYQYYELGIRNPKERTVKRLEFVLGTDLCLSDAEKIETLTRDIVGDMREAKKILNVDNIGEMHVDDVIARLMQASKTV